MMRVAINGFGRIGRTFLRAWCADKKAQELYTIVAINLGPDTSELAAYLFKYDSLMGPYAGHVTAGDEYLVIDGKRIRLYTVLDPQDIPWRKEAIDWVVESSGRFTKRAQVVKHLDAGAKRVVITAPAHDEDIAIIMGVNEDEFHAKKHTIVSLGSCTTNAFIPMLKVLNDLCGIESGFMTTIHAYTSTQSLLDNSMDSNCRRSRAAAINIVPSTTGATEMLGKIMPDLAHAIHGGSVRVPVAKVSLIDLSVIAKGETSIDVIHDTIDHLAQTRMKHVITRTTEELVSSDFMNNAHSVIIDSPLTYVSHRQVKLMGWYDNEWGYSERINDFLQYAAQSQ